MFEKILRRILSISGVEGVVFLDSEGETILCYGEHDPERMKVLGAYQSIVLSQVKNVGWPDGKTVITICEQRSILTRYLKDGYFITVIFGESLNPVYAEFKFHEAYKALEKEL
jgi:hypothetical protein